MFVNREAFSILEDTMQVQLIKAWVTIFSENIQRIQLATLPSSSWNRS